MLIVFHNKEVVDQLDDYCSSPGIQSRWQCSIPTQLVERAKYSGHKAKGNKTRTSGFFLSDGVLFHFPIIEMNSFPSTEIASKDVGGFSKITHERDSLSYTHL